MITKKKLRIYKKYDGDGDAFLRNSWPWQRNSITPEDWSLIRQLLQDVKLVDRKLASDEYARNTESRIANSCLDQETADELKSLAKAL